MFYIKFVYQTLAAGTLRYNTELSVGELNFLYESGTSIQPYPPTPLPRVGGQYACARFVEKKYEVNFCWKVLKGAPGKR